MVAIVTGSTLGLNASSLALIGSSGVVGDAQAGRAGERVYVNAGTGDLVVQREDEWVAGLGVGLQTEVLRTYNSLGKFADDNADNWQMSVAKTLTAYSPGVSVTRNDGDGTALVYSWDGTSQSYLCKSGAGAFDSLRLAGDTWTWRDGDTGGTETYDATSCKIRSASDREGNTTLFGYSGGLLTTITDAAGELTTLGYVGNKLAAITTTALDGSTSSRVSYTYDANNRLASVNALTSGGRTYTTSYTYTKNGQLATMVQPDGSKLSFTYDNPLGRVTQVTQLLTDGSTRVSKLAYSTGKTTVTDPLGGVTTLNYDAAKRLSSIVSPATAMGVQTVSFAYTADGQLARQTDGRGNVVEYVYDAMGRLAQQRSGTNAPGQDGANGTGVCIQRSYSASGVLLAETLYTGVDPDGDALGSAQPGGAALTTRYVYDASEKHVRFIVSPQGRVTEYRYDNVGRRTAQIDYGDQLFSLPQGSLNGDALAAWTAGCDKTASTLTQTSYTAWHADLIKDVTTFAAVDADGAGLVDGRQSVTRYIYDMAGELLYTIAPDAAGTVVDGTSDQPGASHCSYDGLGRVLTRCDAAGRLTVYTYDDAGNKTSVSYASGLTTTTSFDASGRPVTIVNSGAAQTTTRYWWDADTRLRMTQDATGLKSYCLWDAAGHLVGEIDANGTLTESVWNLAGQRIERITYASNLSAAALASLVDAHGNPANVALATIRPAASANDSRQWSFYDADGRQVKTVDERGYVTETQFDGASRIVRTLRYATPVAVASITSGTRPGDAAVSPPANPALDQASYWFRDADGKVTAEVAPDGVLTQNTYDAAGRLRHTATFANHAAVTTDAATGLPVLVAPAADAARDSDLWYFYDGQGQLIAQVDAAGALTEYAYDASGNKVWESLHATSSIVPAAITSSTTLDALRAQAPGTQVTRYAYNAANQLLTRTEADGTVTQYSYDAAGNLVRSDWAVASPDLRTLRVRLDAFGRVTSELSAQGAAALAALGADATPVQIDAVWAAWQVSYSYDSEGRRTAMCDAAGLKTVYYYDNDGQLVFTINAAGEVTQNSYTALGQLQQVTHFGTRLGAAQLATLAGGLLTAAASSTLNIANAALDASEADTYSNGNLVVQRDARGNTTRYLYGSNNRLQYTLDATNALTACNYDVDGRLVSTVSYARPVSSASVPMNAATPLAAAMFSPALLASLADASQDSGTTTVYDSLGRAAFVISGAGSVIARSYDADGKVTMERRYATPIPLPGAPTLAAVQAAVDSVADAAHDAISYFGYDTAGHLTYQADASGGVTTCRYDLAGNLVERRSYANATPTPAAHTLPAEDSARDTHERWVYDSAQHVIGTAVAQGGGSDGLWTITRSSYDRDGHLTASTQYATRLSSNTLPSSPSQADVAAWIAGVPPYSLGDRSSTMSYDRAGRLVAATDAAGTVTRYDYDGAGRLTVTTVAGAATRTVYDALGRAVYQIDALGDVCMNSYDANGNVTALRRYAKALSASALATLTPTSSAGDLAALVTPDNAADRIERRVYDAANRLVYSVDGAGDATIYSRDGVGRVVAERRYACPVNLAAWPASATVASVAALIAADDANDRITRSVYDADGRQRYAIDAAGAVTQTDYDALGQVMRTVRYATPIAAATPATLQAVGAALQGQASAQHAQDRVVTAVWSNTGRLLHTTDARGNSESYTYDALGNRSSFTDKAGSTWRYTYDACGRLLEQTDPSADVSQVAIDASGTPTLSVSEGARMVTHFYRDAFGQLILRTESAVAASGQVLQQRTTSYGYDRLGHQVETDLPRTDVDGQGAVTPYSRVVYDAQGNAVMNRDVAGNYSYKLYDACGRVLFEIDALGEVTGYSRNAFGDVTTLTRYAQPMTGIAAGLLPTLAQVQAFAAAGDHSADRTITTSYDAAGRVVKISEPLATAFDPAHALNAGQNAFTAGRTTRSIYDAFGDLLKQSVEGEDASGAALTVSADTFFRWDLCGRQVAQVSVADRAAGATSASGYLTTQTYDAFGELAGRIEYSVLQSFADAQFSAVNGMAFGAPATDANRRETRWQYDANGNQASETRVGVEYSMAGLGTAVSTVTDAVTRFAWDKLDRLLATTDAAGTTTFSWRDALGRVTATATLSARYKSEQVAQAALGLLGRAPTAAELSSYAGMAFADIARAAFASAEGQRVFAASTAAWGGSADTGFVQQLYQNLMGRAADSAGLASWTSRLATLEALDASANHALAHAQLLLEMIAGIQAGQGQDAAVMNAGVSAALYGSSPSAIAGEQARSLRRVQVAQLYMAVLGRTPDPIGMYFYASAPAPVDAVMAQSFFDSAEGLTVFPVGTSRQELAARLYENLYGQAPSDATLADWTSALPAARSGLGAFVAAKLAQLLAPPMTAALQSFGNKVVAGIVEAADANATPAPLARLQLDAWGNTVLRTDYALGAQYATLSGWGAAASADDRHSYTQYDASGHAIVTVDAMGKLAYSAYDAFGRDVRDWRTVTAADGSTQTDTHTRRYDALGQLVEDDDPGAAHKLRYNAFGEVVARSVNADAAYEYDDYDRAGHLWRTNAGDGADKVFLFDAFGHAVVQAQSAGANLATFKDAGEILTTGAALVRSDFSYDLQGHLTVQQGPAQNAWDIGSGNASPGASLAILASLSTASIAAPQVTQAMTWGVTQMAGDGSTVNGWLGANAVTLAWGSLAGLGSGEVRVEITAVERTDGASSANDWYDSTSAPSFATNVVTQDFAADEAIAGAHLQWTGSGALQSVSRVRIFKKDVNGNWMQLMDRSSWGDGATLLRVKAPADATAPAQLRYAPSGTSNWSTLAALGQFGDTVLYEVSALGEGRFDYQVLQAGAVVQAGTLAAVNTPLRTQIAQLYATILQRSPDMGGFAYYLAQLQPPNSGTLAAVAQALYDAAGAGNSGGELVLPTTAAAMVQQIVQQGIGFTTNNFSSTGELATLYIPRWTAALQAASTSQWGAALAGIVADIATYAGGDADMLRANKLLADKAAVGLNYAVDDGGYTMSEARAEMAALNSGAGVQQAEALGAPALDRLWATRLYVGLLNRAPDAAGLAFHAGSMQSGASFAQVADTIYNSSECKAAGLLWNADGTPLTDAQFVAQLFTVAGNRTASATDIAWWTTRLAQTTRAQVVVELLGGIAGYAGADAGLNAARQLFNNKVAVGLTYAWDVGGSLAASEYALIANSTGAATALLSAQSAVTVMASNYNAAQSALTPTGTAANAYPVEQTRRAVAQLYVSILNRAPDASGLNYWVQQIQAGACTLAQAANTLYTGSEAQSAGLFLNTSDTHFVSTLYQNGFGVAPTSAQLTMWLGELGAQELNRGTVALHIIDSVVNMQDANSLTTRNYFAAKVGVGLAYALDMGGGDGQLAVCRQLMDASHVTLAGDASAAMALAAANVASVAGALAMTTLNGVGAAAPKASADASLASANAAYQAALDADNATPTTANSARFTQVGQLYLACMGRTAGYTEVDYWFKVLLGGTALLDVVNSGFLGSTEGQAFYPPTLTNSQFISKVYATVLGRGVDASGLAFYSNQLQQGTSRGQVLLNITNGFLAYSGPDATEAGLRAAFEQKLSNELASDAQAANLAGYAYRSDLQTAATKAIRDLALYNAITQQIGAQNNASAAQASWNGLTADARRDGLIYMQLTQLYEGGLNRTASLTDESYYWDKLAHQGASMDAVADSFVASAEGRAMYAGLDNSGFINRVYLNTFGRNVDASGLNTYLASFSQGRTRGQVMWAIVQSAVNYYANGGRTASELQNQANFLARVSTAFNAAGGLNIQAQTAALGDNPFINWVNNASLAARQQAGAYGVEASANAALAASPDAQSRLLIVQLYTLLLNRAPDAATLNAAAAQMAAGTTEAQLVASMLATPEAQLLYPAGQSDSAFFAAMFRNTFARNADATESALWTTALAGTTRAQAVVNFAAAITGYTGNDVAGSGLAIESRNAFADKTQVNLVDANRAVVTWVQSLQQQWQDAARVLAPGAGHPAPLDEMQAANVLASGSTGFAMQAQRPSVVRTYDRWGNLLTQSDPRNNAWVTSWTYNANNQVTKSINALGRVSSWAYYDILGRNVATVDANVNLTGKIYDALGNLVEEMHADGGTVQSRYDAFGEKVYSRDAAGSVNTYGYDRLGRVTSVTRAAGVGVDSYIALNAGWDTAALDSAHAVHGSLTQSFVYDELGRRIQVTDDAGNNSSAYYDLRGNVTATYAFGRLTGQTWDAYNHKLSETQAAGTSAQLTESWTYDVFGRVLTHTDQASSGGTRHTFSYDGLKNPVSETSTAGQNLKYSYDASSGLLVKIEDLAVPGQEQVTQYAYDLAGNRTREKTATVRLSDGAEIDVAQDNHITYDALGRETDIRDARYSVQYEYDNNGNRIHQHTHYNTDLQSGAAASAASAMPAATDIDTWNAFDVMNRETVVGGIKTNGVVTIGWDAVNKKALGVQLGYNAAGDRTWARSFGTQLATGNTGVATTEAYFYDAAERLTDTWREGFHTDARYYDKLGRVVQSGGVGIAGIASDRLSAAGVSLNTQINAYAADGQLAQQTLQSIKGGTTANMAYVYDAAGRLSIYYMNSRQGTAYTNGYEYVYDAHNAKLVTTVNGYRMGDQLLTRTWMGETDKGYDANGYLVHTKGQGGQYTVDTRDLVNDAQGRVLKKTETIAPTSAWFGTTLPGTGTHVSTTLIANGEVIGSSGDQGSADAGTFGLDYVPVNDASLSGPSAYTVQPGDTLQSIAKALWGNANLWYVIADANPAGGLAAGSVITIPQKPNAEYSNDETFAPYSQNKAVGDTTPYLPLPTPHHNDFVDFLANAVDVIVSVMPWGGPILGDIAKQAIEIAGDNQHGFNYKEAALAYAGQEITGKVGSASQGTWLGGDTGGAAVARAAIGNAATQGVAMGTGLQKSFNWQGVVTSMIHADSEQAAPASAYGYVSGIDRQSDGYTPMGEGGYRNGMDVQSDAFGNGNGLSALPKTGAYAGINLDQAREYGFVLSDSDQAVDGPSADARNVLKLTPATRGNGAADAIAKQRARSDSQARMAELQQNIDDLNVLGDPLTFESNIAGGLSAPTRGFFGALANGTTASSVLEDGTSLTLGEKTGLGLRGLLQAPVLASVSFAGEIANQYKDIYNAFSGGSDAPSSALAIRLRTNGLGETLLDAGYAALSSPSRPVIDLLDGRYEAAGAGFPGTLAFGAGVVRGLGSGLRLSSYTGIATVDFSTGESFAPGLYRADPAQLRFMQPTVSPNFSDGGTIDSLAADLRAGRITPDQVRGGPLRVVMMDGEPFSFDHRRLVSYNLAGIDNVPIQVMGLNDPLFAAKVDARMNPIQSQGRQVVIVPATNRGAVVRELYNFGLVPRSR